MANEHVKREFLKIYDDNQQSYPTNAALGASWIIANYKGYNIKAFDMTNTSSLCEYNIIATADNTTQAKTMVDEICHNLRAKDIEILSTEGLSDAVWILIDAGDIIIHIFQEHSRGLYDLDSIWKTNEQLTIPADYYFSSHDQESSQTSESSNQYF